MQNNDQQALRSIINKFVTIVPSLKMSSSEYNDDFSSRWYDDFAIGYNDDIWEWNFNIEDAKKYVENHKYKYVDEISKYERIAKVGQGSFGEVFKARARSDGTLVAMKKVAMDEHFSFPKTSLHEIEILRHLAHKNIIKIIEVCNTLPTAQNRYKPTFYLILEFCEHDLAGLIGNANVELSLVHIKEVMKQLLNGLYFMHFNKIIHRDLKPANILITKNGVLKIGDFGLARAFSIPRDGKANRYTNRIVTLWYRPPELLLGERNYGPIVDMWSAGCIMAELWTRIAIFPGYSEQRQITLISNLCGSFTPEVWPEIQDLELYQNMQLPQGRKRRLRDCLKPYVKDPCGMDLVDKLLVLDPKQRIDADTALNHDFFWTDPMPCDLSGMLSQHTHSMYAFFTPYKRAIAWESQHQNNNNAVQAPSPYTEHMDIDS